MEAKINLVISLDDKTANLLQSLIAALGNKPASTSAPEVHKAVKPVPTVTTREVEVPAKKVVKVTPVEVVDKSIPQTEAIAPAETATSSITIEELRKILGEKSRAGHKQEIEEILISYGSRVLKNIDPVHYEEIAAKVEAIQ